MTTNKNTVVGALLLALLILITGDCRAVPACPEPAMIRQPDGRVIQVYLKGDEFLHWHEDTLGYTILRLSKTDSWFYAVKDPLGALVSSGALVGRDDPLLLNVPKHLLQNGVLTQSMARRQAQIGTRVGKMAPHIGTMKNLVVLAEFSDLPHVRTKVEYEALFNTIGYSVDGAVGSVKDYYKEVSYNALTVDSVVADWVTLSHGYVYYDTRPGEMVQEALAKLEARGFDFSTLDSDSDGWVDGFTVIHSGGGEEYAGNDPNYIHSHYGAMPSTVTYDGKSMLEYHTEPERRGWDNSPLSWGITRIGVICHENGHFIGLPDLYDDGYDSEGVGRFCLMAAGSWNGNSGTQPAHMSAWCKKRLAWLNSTIVSSSGTYNVPQVENNSGSSVYQLNGSFPATQYFLVENRQGYGFDASLPGSTRGLLIWHVDETQGNNNDQTHYKVDLEEASGTQHLEMNTDSGDDADYYRQGNNTTLNASSSPNNRSYSGSALGLDVSAVSAAGSVMTFTVGSLSLPRLTNPRVVPQSGTPSTTFEFLVDYYDPNGLPPLNGYKTIYLSGGANYQMTLKSGTTANGTYHYSTTLPLGSYNHFYFFANASGWSYGTPWQSGPDVHSDGCSVELRVSVSGGPATDNISARLGYGPDLANLQYEQWYYAPQLPHSTWISPGQQLMCELSTVSANHTFLHWGFTDDDGNEAHADMSGSSSGFIWTGGNLHATAYLSYTPQTYTISGTVLNDSTPVPGGVDLTLQSSQQTLTQHSGDGNFSFLNVQGGVAVNITCAAAGYNFSPASLLFNNLRQNWSGQTISAYSSDELSPETFLEAHPNTISTSSTARFTWRGQDNVTTPSSIRYQYMIENIDSDWSALATATSTVYTLPNGSYTFNVRGVDEVSNVNQAPVTYTFTVNAAPQVTSVAGIDRSVWASRVRLYMPVGAARPTNGFVMIPTQWGMSDSDFIPAYVHRVNQCSPCGAHELIATKEGLPVKISRTKTGWFVIPPDALVPGQTIQFDILWGAMKVFGWRDYVSIARGLPNIGQSYAPYGGSGNINGRCLSDNLDMYRIATKTHNYSALARDQANWLIMNIMCTSGTVRNETELRYNRGRPWQTPVPGTQTQYKNAKAIRAGANIGLLWTDEINNYDGTLPVVSQRLECVMLDTSNQVVNSYQSEYYGNGTSWTIPKVALGNRIWFLCKDNTRSASFLIMSLEGNVVVPKTTFASSTTTNFSVKNAVQLGVYIVLAWHESWITPGGDDREEAKYQVRDATGGLVCATTTIETVWPDSSNKNDYVEMAEAKTDKSGKVWISYYRDRQGLPTSYKYLILDTSGGIWKGPVQTSSERDFMFCDRDGKIWATEGGQLLPMNDNDTAASYPRQCSLYPYDTVRTVAVYTDLDGYRLFDRWTPASLHIDLPIGIEPGYMKAIDLDMWSNELHCAGISVNNGGSNVWSYSGTFSNTAAIEVRGKLNAGINLLAVSQNDFLGGQIMFTFGSVPMTPSAPDASDSEIGHITVRFAPADGATKYKVYRRTAGDMFYVTNISGEITQTNFVDSTMPIGETNYYWVKAGNSNGWSSFSPSDVGFTVPEPGTVMAMLCALVIAARQRRTKL